MAWSSRAGRPQPGCSGRAFIEHLLFTWGRGWGWWKVPLDAAPPQPCPRVAPRGRVTGRTSARGGLLWGAVGFPARLSLWTRLPGCPVWGAAPRCTFRGFCRVWGDRPGALVGSSCLGLPEPAQSAPRAACRPGRAVPGHPVRALLGVSGGARQCHRARPPSGGGSVPRPAAGCPRWAFPKRAWPAPRAALPSRGAARSPWLGGTAKAARRPLSWPATPGNQYRAATVLAFRAGQGTEPETSARVQPLVSYFEF